MGRNDAACELQSQQDQQFEERLRVAENLVRRLREAGFSCELSNGPAQTLKPDN